MLIYQLSSRFKASLLDFFRHSSTRNLPNDIEEMELESGEGFVRYRIQQNNFLQFYTVIQRSQSRAEIAQFFLTGFGATSVSKYSNLLY
jgi:hypothetical protein